MHGGALHGDDGTEVKQMLRPGMLCTAVRCVKIMHWGVVFTQCGWVCIVRAQAYVFCGCVLRGFDDVSYHVSSVSDLALVVTRAWTDEIVCFFDVIIVEYLSLWVIQATLEQR